jgi:hypothetical protein
MVPRQLDSTLGEPCDFGQRSAAMIPEIEIVSLPIPPSPSGGRWQRWRVRAASDPDLINARVRHGHKRCAGSDATHGACAIIQVESLAEQMFSLAEAGHR